jgi:hypothetical protein
MRNTVACWCLFLLFFGLCSRDKAVDLYGAAQAEETQNNRVGAEATYERIIREFPDTTTATKARERLAALRGLSAAQDK